MNIKNEQQKKEALAKLAELVKDIEAYDEWCNKINWYSFKKNNSQNVPRGEYFFNNKI